MTENKFNPVNSHQTNSRNNKINFKPSSFDLYYSQLALVFLFGPQQLTRNVKNVKKFACRHIKKSS